MWFRPDPPTSGGFLLLSSLMRADRCESPHVRQSLKAAQTASSLDFLSAERSGAAGRHSDLPPLEKLPATRCHSRTLPAIHGLTPGLFIREKLREYSARKRREEEEEEEGEESLLGTRGKESLVSWQFPAPLARLARLARGARGARCPRCPRCPRWAQCPLDEPTSGWKCHTVQIWLTSEQLFMRSPAASSGSKSFLCSNKERHELTWSTHTLTLTHWQHWQTNTHTLTHTHSHAYRLTHTHTHTNTLTDWHTH